MQAEISFRRTTVGLMLVFVVLATIGIARADSSSITDSSDTHRPRSVATPFSNWVKVRGQSINYAPVVLYDSKEAAEKSDAQPTEPNASTTEKPVSISVEEPTLAPRNTSPFKTTYNAKDKNQDVAKIMPKITSDEKARSNDQGLDDNLDSLNQTTIDKNLPQGPRVIKAWGFGLG